MASQQDWKRNPTPQALLNPWTKWMKRNIVLPIASSSKPPVRKGVKIQREIQQSISTPLPGEPSYPTTSTHIRHEPSPQQQQPPSPDKLLPLLTKDDKFYLIGQKLSSLLNQDQQSRLLRDALDAGKLPPTRSTTSSSSANCICPDIMVDIQNMIRAEFDHGLAQTHRLVIQPPNNVVVIQHPTYNGMGQYDKPLPGLPPAEDWSAQGTYRYPYPNNHKDHRENFEYGDGIPMQPMQPMRPPQTTPPQPVKLELTSLRFPKPGLEPYLHCAPCQADHPTRLFSAAQRRVPAGVRKCIAREGYVRLCAHKVVTWNLVEACLRRGLGIDGDDDGDSDQNHNMSDRDGAFTFTCQHPSHPRAPQVIIHAAAHPRPGDRGNKFGRVVLRWSLTQPPCRMPIGTTPDMLSQMPDPAGANVPPEEGPFPPDLQIKNVICPGPPLSPTVPLSSTHASCHDDFSISSQVSYSLSSSYPRSLFSCSSMTAGGDRSSRCQSVLTNPDCACPGTINSDPGPWLESEQPASKRGNTMSGATSNHHNGGGEEPGGEEQEQEQELIIQAVDPGSLAFTLGPTLGLDLQQSDDDEPQPQPIQPSPIESPSPYANANDYNDSSSSSSSYGHGNSYGDSYGSTYNSPLKPKTRDAYTKPLQPRIPAQTGNHDHGRKIERSMRTDQLQYQYTHPHPRPRPRPPPAHSVRTSAIETQTGPRTRSTPMRIINPSPEWYTSLHPDSYCLDKWAKEGLFGLRWCSEAGCKSYIPHARMQLPEGTSTGTTYSGPRIGNSR